MNGMLVDLGTPVVGSAVATVPLAQNPEPPPGQGEEFGKASPVALVVILCLAVATVILVRSMTKHLKRLPASFDEEPVDEPADQPQRESDAPRD